MYALLNLVACLNLKCALMAIRLSCVHFEYAERLAAVSAEANMDPKHKQINTLTWEFSQTRGNILNYYLYFEVSISFF